MNREYYSDPTAERAIGNVMREYRNEKRLNKAEGGADGKKSQRKGRNGKTTI